MNKSTFLLIFTLFFSASAIPWDYITSCRYPLRPEQCWKASNLQFSQIPDWGKTVHMKITLQVPTPWEVPLPLDGCNMVTYHLNKKTNQTEDGVRHQDIDKKYIHDYSPGEIFTLEYDLQIERNAFPKNGLYTWGISPCFNSTYYHMCMALVFVEVTFTLGTTGMMEVNVQDIQSSLAKEQ